MRIVKIVKNKRTIPLPFIPREDLQDIESIKKSSMSNNPTTTIKHLPNKYSPVSLSIDLEDDSKTSNSSNKRYVDGLDEFNSSGFNKSKSLLASDVGLVQVRMQNTTVIEGGPTKLIYSVHLAGKAVPADKAAKDMMLLSEQEVALVLGAPVIIQSEREIS